MGKRKLESRQRWKPLLLSDLKVLDEVPEQKTSPPVTDTRRNCSSYETGGVEGYDEGNGPLLPTDLVMDILDSLSLKDLLLSARKVCRMWNTMAMHCARKLISSWSEKVQLAVPNDVEIIYYGTRSKIHWGESLISHPHQDWQINKMCHFDNGAQMEVKFSALGSRQPDAKDIPRYSTPKVETLQVGFLGNFLDVPQNAWRERSLQQRLWIRFDSFLPVKQHRRTPECKWTLGHIEVAQPMRVRSVWLEDMNLTSLILEQFRFHFEFVGQFETRGLGWMKHSPKDTKEGYFLGYKGTLQILARAPFEQTA